MQQLSRIDCTLLGCDRLGCCMEIALALARKQARRDLKSYDITKLEAFRGE